MSFNLLSTSRLASAFLALGVAVAPLLALAPGCGSDVERVHSAEGSGSGSGGAPHDECAPPSADCNGDPADGCEVDLGSDPANCGKCDVDCGGGACSSGVCLEAPVVLANGRLPWMLALNSTGVFFADINLTANGFAIYRVAKDGSAFAPLTADSPAEPEGLAVNDTSAFWTEHNEECVEWCSYWGSVYAAPVQGGAPTRLVATDNAEPYKLVVDDTHIYWIESSQIRRVPLGGGDPETVIAGGVFRLDLVIDKTRLYWLPLDVKETVIMSADKSGAGQGPLFETSLRAGQLAQNDSWIYWSSNQDPSGATLRIERINVAGGASSVVVSSMPSGYFSVHQKFVYWTEATPGRVLRAPVGGGSPEILAAGLYFPREIAVDDSGIYWLTAMDGGWPAVMRLPLP